jgi:ATP phosphoribosyltransferase
LYLFFKLIVMELNGSNLKIAIQKKGRLTDFTLDLLRRSGLEFEVYGNRLFSNCRNFPLDILFLRDDDIPEYVQDGVCDLGIVGRNVVREKNAEVEELEPLGFGRCRLALAVPKDSEVTSLDQLEGKVIATSYPTILSSFLKDRDVEAEVVEVRGSVEITPSLKVADAICDLVSTGSTLMMNGLVVLEEVFKSEALLVANSTSIKVENKQRDCERLLVRIRSSLLARRRKYIMMNAPRKALSKIEAILPGLESPTVVPLAEEGMIAIHSVVAEDTFWDDIERLKEAGATGILVLPIEKIIL